ncbi:MAG TPA: glutathione peroxidase [Mycobacteriales bacterium]|nr:glutathione peroxidase [Mycobacteriales bacterium]
MSLLDTSIATLDGSPSTLADLTGGKTALVVNVASKCGLTPQYTGLEELQKELGDRGVTVLGVPCNQFGAQEPGTADEIQTFCSTTYGVTFPLTEKVDVNGEQQHPLYKELTQTADAEGKAGDVQWNFEKFLLRKDGTVAARFRPMTDPHDPALIAAIEAEL